jgi:hypothetical protein
MSDTPGPRNLAFATPTPWLRPILDSTARRAKDGDMGFIDSLKEALGGDHDDRPEAASAASQSPAAHARHVDRDAPAERIEDAALNTGGRHRADLLNP